MSPITLPDFVAKWTASTRTERAASQEHFIDLCRLLDQPTPNEADATGAFYAFEKGTTKVAGGGGFADVWRRGYFAWEYKGKHKDLNAAYQQLLQYREDLENPPLLVVCDLNRFEVHTNFTGTAKHVYAFALTDLPNPEATPTSDLPPLEVLRAAFTYPQGLRPDQTTSQVTERAAAEFAKLAESLRQRGNDPEVAARFLMRVLFCLFSEDIGLLPQRLFSQLVDRTRKSPADFAARLRQLFAAMASGGFYGNDDVAHFNGGLFSDDGVLGLTTDDLAILAWTSQLDWSSIEPAIFGTLFERSLDPSKRSQLGAHYTSREDILLIVEPVLLEPLRRRWRIVQQEAEAILAKREDLTREQLGDRGVERARNRLDAQAIKVLGDFVAEIASIRVLDPACGSGNFLYVALKRLLDLEKSVMTFAASHSLPGFIPCVGPEQLHGIEVNAYARELAQVSIWIGYIQWLHDNGYGVPSSPILKPLDAIEEKDAVLTYDAAGHPAEPPWPDADVIVGNPPFLGGKLLRRELGDKYVDELFRLYNGRVPREADLVTYWYERAREQIAAGKAKRAGLLATQAVRGGANRKVLERIKQTGDIFLAWSDRAWILDGAAVHVSLVGFDDGAEQERTRNGSPVPAINADLTAGLDLTLAPRLKENLRLAFMGDTKGGSFDVAPDVAERFLRAPLNPNGRPNSDVVHPWINGLDVTRRPRGMWIVDFGVSLTQADAALYEAPFAYVLQHVKAEREGSRTTRSEWWLHERPRVDMRAALAPVTRFIVTPNLTKYRLFAWAAHPTLPDHQLIVVARDDDYFFGILHSRVHELWARAMGTQLREVESGFRYTPTTTFETFPFPWPPGQEPTGDPRVEAIAAAACDLVQKRDAWLNPPGASEADLKTRTLTNLYNQRPTWLALAHQVLDHAVLDAYGWPHDLADAEILQRLLVLNSARVPA